MLKYRIKIILDYCKEKGAVFNRSFFLFTVNYTIKCNRRGRKKGVHADLWRNRVAKTLKEAAFLF